MSTSTPKRLTIQNFPAWRHAMMLETKKIGTWRFMTGQNDKCLLSLEVESANEGKDKARIARALFAKEKASQATVLVVWNSLHRVDQAKVTDEMEDDNLVGMWKGLQMTPTIEELDVLMESLYHLKCGSRDPMDFICECKLQQERLHASEEGAKMKTGHKSMLIGTSKKTSARVVLEFVNLAAYFQVFQFG